MTTRGMSVKTLVNWRVDVVFGLPDGGTRGSVEAMRTYKTQDPANHARREETARAHLLLTLLLRTLLKAV
jgi:thiamine pyrophosphate-dependent acetolactate synthase large subunit-like protein